MNNPSGDQIWFLGDVHGDRRHVIAELIRARKEGKSPAAVVFLGDIEADRPFAQIAEEIRFAGNGTDAWFIHGNHDSDTPAFASNLFDAPGADRNLHGRVVKVAGVRIAGLGGIFEQEIWHPDAKAGNPSWASYEAYAAGLTSRGARITPESAAGRLQKHRTSIFYNMYEQLYGDNADVLVTHEAPLCHPAGIGLIDELGESLNVRRMFHGHHHDNLDYSQLQPPGVVVRGVGYRGITALGGRSVRPGAFDGNRSA